MKGQKRSFIIAVLLVTLVGATIGYAALATNLFINGTAGVSGDTSWLVEFTNATESTKTGNPITNTLDYTGGTTFTFDVTLNEPGEAITYEVTVTNNGSIDAKLDSITSLDTINATDPTQIVYGINGITEGDVLTAGQSQTFYISVAWTPGTDIPTGTLTKTAAITLNYVQNNA